MAKFTTIKAFLPAKLVKKLNRLARKRGITKSELCRQAINDFLAEDRRERRGKSINVLHIATTLAAFIIISKSAIHHSHHFHLSSHHPQARELRAMVPFN